MFCTKCGAEYIDGFDICPDCALPLTGKQEPVNQTSLSKHFEPVTIFKAGDHGLIAVAKSLLMSADIKFFTKNEHIQNVLGYGLFGAGQNYVTGPVEFLVSPKDAQDARELLSDLLK